MQNDSLTASEFISTAENPVWLDINVKRLATEQFNWTCWPTGALMVKLQVFVAVVLGVSPSRGWTNPLAKVELVPLQTLNDFACAGVGFFVVVTAASYIWHYT